MQGEFENFRLGEHLKAEKPAATSVAAENQKYLYQKELKGAKALIKYINIYKQDKRVGHLSNLPPKGGKKCSHS